MKRVAAQNFDQIRNYAASRQKRRSKLLRSQRIKSFSNRNEPWSEIEAELDEKRWHHRESHS